MQRMARLIAAILAVAASLVAQSPGPEQIAKIFAAYQHPDTPGCAVGLEAPERDAWAAAYGMADLEHAVANTPATVFEVGSVSKQFTAAAVLLLVERGQVSLDDNIRKYFPEILETLGPITVRQLLNHTSGLRDWGELADIEGWPRTTREHTHAHVLEILSRQQSLNYAPGDAWSYTNSGFNLAAMLVERVTGTTLQAFCRREFFEPLGMASTQWRDDFRRIVPNRAIAYARRASEWRQDMPFEDVYGNGGLLSTVGDLLKWNRNLRIGTLHPALFASMQKPGALNDGRTIGYGFGFFLEDFQELAEVSHSGATAGYRAWLGRIPSKNLSIAVICNAASANPTDYAHQIARLYLHLPNPPPPVFPNDFKPGLYRRVRDHSTITVGETNGALTVDGKPFDRDVRFDGSRMIVSNPTYGEEIWDWVKLSTPSNLGALEGFYFSFEAQSTLRVAVEGGKLMIHRRPDDTFVLTPAGADAFDSALGNVQFERDGSGNGIAIVLSRSRVWNLRFERMHPNIQLGALSTIPGASPSRSLQ
jgi:CubicO group peptidase (beta-lactamase class C family)